METSHRDNSMEPRKVKPEAEKMSSAIGTLSHNFEGTNNISTKTKNTLWKLCPLYSFLNTNSRFLNPSRKKNLHSQHSIVVFKCWKIPYVLTKQAHNLSHLRAVCIQKLLQSHGGHELATQPHTVKGTLSLANEGLGKNLKST